MSKHLRVALIQGSLDTVFDVTPQRLAQTLTHYHELTVEAVQRAQPLDLVVWPESAFVIPEMVLDASAEPTATPPHADTLLAQRLAAAQADFQARLAYEAQTVNAKGNLPGAGGSTEGFGSSAATGRDSPAGSAHTAGNQRGTWLAVGTTTYVFEAGTSRSYNTAVLADPTGTVRGRYAKMHLVMFGEYIPLGDRLPWLYQLTPLTSGLAVGDRPVAFEVAGLRLAPSICFESTVPHLIRRQIAQLQQHGQPVDLLVNFTNDGWFWGSAMLDLHFRCGVFRAVENRKPLLVAANTGLSAVIDGNGVVQQRGPRRQPDLLIATVRADGRRAPYGGWGDLPAGICTAACGLWGLSALAAAFRRRTRPPDGSGSIDYTEKKGTKSPARASKPSDSGPASAPG
jgi:apolipoprotein N-acyltransferase